MCKTKNILYCALTVQFQLVIFIVVGGLLGANIYGTTQLKQQFEPKWFLPTGTIVRDYMDLNDEVLLPDFEI